MPTTPGTFSYDFSNPQQMTFLLNSELSPAFMQDGRVSFTAEKATPDFYQLSGRRMNWDLTDYHPLLAQRAQSTSTFDNNLAARRSATSRRRRSARGWTATSCSSFRTRGRRAAAARWPRSTGRSARSRPIATDVTFVKSMVIVDPAAAPAADGTTAGAYRSPFSLPNGEILASYDGNVTNTDDRPGAAVRAGRRERRRTAPSARSPATGRSPTSRRRSATSAARRSCSRTSRSWCSAATPARRTPAATASCTSRTCPVLATLLGANLRRGRDVAAFDAVASLKVYQDMPPPGRLRRRRSSPRRSWPTSSCSRWARPSLLADHSLKALVPAGMPLILEFDDESGNALFTMTEEHQVTPGEYITPGPPRAVFNNICGGCHGSLERLRAGHRGQRRRPHRRRPSRCRAERHHPADAASGSLRAVPVRNGYAKDHRPENRRKHASG